jgi:hypothetical protein
MDHNFGPIYKESNYMTIQNIATQLQEMSSRLESGALTADEIMTMTELSRQLHERLIILQYKAFEEQVQLHDHPDTDPGEPATGDANEDAPAALAEPEEVLAPREPEEENEPEASPEIRSPFRFGEPEVSPNQISLIDSIEEIKRMEQSINESFKASESPSLAQKLVQKPISDLRKAIGINQRFQFVSVLFESDTAAFEQAIVRLNEASSYIEADEYIQNTLKNKYDWQMKNPVVKELINLVERRFL